jgi:hypothetical protein
MSVPSTLKCSGLISRALLRLRCHLVKEQLGHVVLLNRARFLGQRAVFETEKRVVAHCSRKSPSLRTV